MVQLGRMKEDGCLQCLPCVAVLDSLIQALEKSALTEQNLIKKYWLIKKCIQQSIGLFM